MNTSQSSTSNSLQYDARSDLKSRDLVPISVEEARRIMGESAPGLTDDEVQNLVYDLTFIARDYIRSSKMEAIQEI